MEKKAFIGKTKTLAGGVSCDVMSNYAGRLRHFWSFCSLSLE